MRLHDLWVNARALFEQVYALEPPERLKKLLSVQRRLPKSKKALEYLLQDPRKAAFGRLITFKPWQKVEGAHRAGQSTNTVRPLSLDRDGKLHKRLALQSADEKGMIQASSTDQWTYESGTLRLDTGIVHDNVQLAVKILIHLAKQFHNRSFLVTSQERQIESSLRVGVKGSSAASRRSKLRDKPSRRPWRRHTQAHFWAMP